MFRPHRRTFIHLHTGCRCRSFGTRLGLSLSIPTIKVSFILLSSVRQNIHDSVQFQTNFDRLRCFVLHTDGHFDVIHHIPGEGHFRRDATERRRQQESLASEFGNEEIRRLIHPRFDCKRFERRP